MFFEKITCHHCTLNSLKYQSFRRKHAESGCAKTVDIQLTATSSPTQIRMITFECSRSALQLTTDDVIVVPEVTWCGGEWLSDGHAAAGEAEQVLVAEPLIVEVGGGGGGRRRGGDERRKWTDCRTRCGRRRRRRWRWRQNWRHTRVKHFGVVCTSIPASREYIGFKYARNWCIIQVSTAPRRDRIITRTQGYALYTITNDKSFNKLMMVKRMMVIDCSGRIHFHRPLEWFRWR